MFPLRFDFPIQKACWLNQEDTKVKTSARARSLRKKKAGRSSRTTGKPRARQALQKQHGALTEPNNKIKDRIFINIRTFNWKKHL
jgi:hypothetical protein